MARKVTGASGLCTHEPSYGQSTEEDTAYPRGSVLRTRKRVERWRNDRENLWKEVVKRSTTQRASKGDPKKPDKRTNAQRIEKAALAALSVGDVRKALQQLKSAPIAPKTDATYAKLLALHPKGNNPAPVERIGSRERYEAPPTSQKMSSAPP